MSELENILKNILKDLEHYIKLMAVKAKLCREYYEYLIEEGFSEQEALELCKHFKLGDS